MLAGLDPIIIFQLYKNIDVESTSIVKGIPITSKAKQRATFAVIPIYLSETVTGLFIDTESKNIDINTEATSLTVGEPALIDQKMLGSITTVNLFAKLGSTGLTILLALSELILDKVTSQEYEVTYMHESVTIFGGLIHSFSYDTNTNDDLVKIKIEISRGHPRTKSVELARDPNAITPSTSGTLPPPTPPAGGSAAASSGTSVIQPSIGVVRP